MGKWQAGKIPGNLYYRPKANIPKLKKTVTKNDYPGGVETRFKANFKFLSL